MNYNLKIHAFVVLRYLYSFRNSRDEFRQTTDIFHTIKKHPAVMFKCRMSVRAALHKLKDFGLVECDSGPSQARTGDWVHVWAITDEGVTLIEDVRKFESPD